MLSGALAYRTPAKLPHRVENAMGSKGKSDISNFAIRAFLQKVGTAYDTARQLEPFKPTARQWNQVLDFFDESCCYCGSVLKKDATTKDHLIPLNKESLGLHAWGNVVPCCRECNAVKHNENWGTFLRSRSGRKYDVRLRRIRAFQRKYRYSPRLNIQTIASNLYQDVGEVAMTLVELRFKQAAKEIARITKVR